jgi:bifunctional non-homologous end joining protein LigD
VIGGVVPPTEHCGFGNLLLGRYDERGHLIYVGEVSTGFLDVALHQLTMRLPLLQQRLSPFAGLPERILCVARFVQPKLVGQIKFSAWGADELLLDPHFQGLREDLPPTAVIARETRNCHQVV